MRKKKAAFTLVIIASLLVSSIPLALSQPPSEPDRYGGRVDHIKFKVIKQPDAQTLAMARRELDILIDLIRPVDIETLNREHRRILSTPGDHFCYLCANLRRFPFGPTDGDYPGLALRHAIAHSVPKTVLIGTLFKYIVTLIHVPMSAALGDFGADIDQHPFDMAMAEEVLLEAGWYVSGGNWYNSDDDLIEEFDFMSPTQAAAPTSWTIAETVCQNLRTLGFTVSHSEYDLTTLIDLIDSGNYDMYFLCWTNLGRFGDHLHDFFHSSMVGPGKNNRPGLNNPELDQVLEWLYYNMSKSNQEAMVKLALEKIMGTSAYQNTNTTDGLVAYVPVYSRTYYNAHDEHLMGLVNSLFYGSWDGPTVSNMYWESGYERESDLNASWEMVIFCQGEDYQYPANPAWVSSAVTWDHISYMYDGLISINPFNLKDSYYPSSLNVNLDPDWPETPGYYVEHPWTVTDGPAAGETGMVVTFYLNTTVPRYWHDGHQFDVYDIAFAWEFLTANAVPRAWGVMQYLHHVTVWNSTTISAYMTTTGLTVPYDLSGWSMLFPEHIWGSCIARDGRGAVYNPATDNRTEAWNAQQVWNNLQGGTAGTKLATDQDADVESGLCTTGATKWPRTASDPDPVQILSKTTCEYSSGCVIDDRETVENEVLDYNPDDFPIPNAAYPFLTEQIGTGPYVWRGVNPGTGIGHLVAYTTQTHKEVMPNLHYWQSVDEIHEDLAEDFWEVGDIDEDGRVRVVWDLATMGLWFFSPCPPAPYSADITPYPLKEDFVDMTDMALAAKSYGEEREIV